MPARTPEVDYDALTVRLSVLETVHKDEEGEFWSYPIAAGLAAEIEPDGDGNVVIYLRRWARDHGLAWEHVIDTISALDTDQIANCVLGAEREVTQYA